MSTAEVLPIPEDPPIADLPEPILRELRSDHAGELGAVWIYRGILAVSRDPGVRAFALEHQAAEAAHLDYFVTHLPRAWHTKLAPLWRLAGFLLGAGPALLGPRAVFATVAAVEDFVDDHYALQIEMLAAHPAYGALRERLVSFRDDELAHREDARRKGGGGPIRGVWASLVRSGSAIGAQIARRV